MDGLTSEVSKLYNDLSDYDKNDDTSDSGDYPEPSGYLDYYFDDDDEDFDDESSKGEENYGSLSDNDEKFNREPEYKMYVM